VRRSVIASAFLFVYVVLSGAASMAQDSAPPVRNRIPFVRAGLYFGRTGIAEGPGAYLEINPLPWLGFCAIVSHSQTNHDIDDGHARVSDLSTGGCVTAHLPEMKGFRISPFVQRARENEHNRFDIPLGDGTIYRDGDDERHRVWTVGATIDRAIVKNGPRWVARMGRNFGGGPAANNADGLYFVGGLLFPLDHPVELGRSLERMVGRKTPVADSASAYP
jgi:hypothetical protein